MSEGTAPKGKGETPELDLSSLAKRSNAAEANMARLLASQKLTGRVRTGLVLAILVLVIIWVVLIVKTFTAFDRGKFEQLATKEAELILPKVRDEMRRVANAVVPVYAKAMKEQTKTLSHDMATAFQTQIDKYKRYREDTVKTRFHDAVVHQRLAHEAYLVQRFPQLKKDPRLVKKIVRQLYETVYAQAQLELYSAIDGNINAMMELKKTFDQLSTDQGGKRYSAEEMLSSWIELLDFKLTAEPPLERVKKKKKPKKSRKKP